MVREIQEASVSRGLALDQHWSCRALARKIGEGMEYARDGGIRRENPDKYHGDDGKRNYQRNQQRAQVRPTFLLVPAKMLRTRIVPITCNPSLYPR
jgi:hypothetical protein